MGSKPKSGGPKPGTKQAKAAADKSAQRTQSPSPNESDPPKKPTVKELIGGASWTGKLPVNLLSEHCQKQKWEKPEYTMVKTSDGFLSSVILRKMDSKTREITTLPPMKLPSTLKHLVAQPTALEARHLAATYALFRVCNKQNLYMVMPPNYRKLWKEDFTGVKNVDMKEGEGWLYESDPFLAKQERNVAAAEHEKSKVERGKVQLDANDKKIDLGGNVRVQLKGGKIWSQAPKVDMGVSVRRDIEGLLKQHAVWNPYGIQISAQQKAIILEELIRLGFRKSHIEEALEECKDREEVLEWLLIFVPEDDLPPWSLPEGYIAGITLTIGNFARESKIKRLASAGYSIDLCSQVLDSKDGDETLAAEYLQQILVHGEDFRPYVTLNSDKEVWDEEQSTLEAIFGDRYKKISPQMCEITGDVPELSGLSFRLQIPSSCYPNSPPTIHITSKSLPAYIRLSAIRQVVLHAEETLLGEPMVFNIIDWLEANIPHIVENPGSLRDISQATGPTSYLERNTKIPIRVAHNKPRNVNRLANLKVNESIRGAWELRQRTQAQQEMIEKRKLLPAWSMQAAIIDVVNSFQVTIITGETGSGKSTQSVQFLLDDLINRNLGDSANIVCTQPRRISALGLAERVSDERCCSVGDEVGYVIRGDSRAKPGQTKITFMTTGVLLRRIQTGQGSNGNIAASLMDISHVVVDEVHERSLDTDFLLAILRDALNYRKDLKVILMSATLDAGIFTRYFGGDGRVGQVNIAGRSFPVEDLYIDDVLRLSGFDPKLSNSLHYENEDIDADVNEGSLGKVLRGLGMGINYDIIRATVQMINSRLGKNPGAILIFLPGTMEIDRCLALLGSIPNIYALPLHASLLPSEQKRVFQPPPFGKRKVIAATNVAETSITIEDVIAVIDTGRVKETRYDAEDNVVRLLEAWASQAACKQRRGRAGRVSAGTCYKLYTRGAESKMAARPDPEIRRVPLEQLCLSVLSMKGVEDAGEFLSKTITPPESIAVKEALDALHRIGALDNHKLTALGRYLSMIPADLRCAKLMVFGSIFGCLNASITIAAILTVKSPFVSPRGKREDSATARISFSKGDGDLLTDFSAYQQWAELVRNQGYWQTLSWCADNFLSHQTLREISSNRAQFISSLKDAGLIPIDYSAPSDTTPYILSRWDHNGTNIRLLKALIAGAFNPQIAQISFPDKKFAVSVTGTIEIDPDARTIKYFSQENGRVFIHPSSTLFSAQNYSDASYISYFSKMATTKVFIRDLTPLNAFSLLLFAGPIHLDTMGRGLIVDGWFCLQGWARIGVLVSRLRLLLDNVLASRIDNPSLSLADSQPKSSILCYENRVIDLVKRLIEFNGLDQ